LVIEKASIDAEIAKFTRLRSQHADTQYRIRSSVRRLAEEIPVMQERLENLKADMAHRKETRGDAFKIQILNQVYTDRAQAGDTLNRLGSQIAGKGCEKEIGEFAGFKLILRAGFLDRVDIMLKCKNMYSANFSDNGLGTIRSMEYAVQNLEESQSRCLSGIADSEKRKAELEAKIGQPFEHEEKLQSLTVRQQDILKALDITKSQAASSQDSANSEDEGVSVSPAIENRQAIEKPSVRRAVAVGV
jgi:hypothetical protein